MRVLSKKPLAGLSHFRKFFRKDLDTTNGSKNEDSVNGSRLVFDVFELDPTERTLLRDGQRIPLTGKVFDVLLVFLENPGRLLGKDELIEKVWPGDFVEEGNLARNVSTLRKALGDEGKEHKYIATVQGRGYRFIAKVDSNNECAGSLPVEVTVKPRPFYRRRALWIIPVLAIFAIGLWIGKDRIFVAWENQIHSIAVLPFENLSGDPSQEYFADGMTEALISDLSQIKALKVISRTSVMQYKGKRGSLPEIARTLGVDAVIEGSVQRSEGRVKVTAQLIHAATDTHIWSRSYEREMTDILKLQSDVAQAVAREVRVQLSPPEQNRLSSARSIDSKASEAYLKGRYHLQKLNEADLALAVGYFSEAIRIEPDYAAAHAGLSQAWFERGIWGQKTFAEVEAPAREAVTRALELDPDLSLAHSTMSYLNMNYDWDWDAAEMHLKRALELDPNSSQAYVAYGWFLLPFGRFDEMVEKMKMAEQLDPVSTKIQSDFGRMLYRAQRYDEAEQHLKRAIELDVNSSSAYGRLSDVYVEMGRFSEAQALIEKGVGVRTDGAYDIRRAYIYARSGEKNKAAELLKHLPIIKNTLDRAKLFTEMGQFDQAFTALNDGLDRKAGVLGFIRVEPGLYKLHSDPRWPLLMKRMNLPE